MDNAGTGVGVSVASAAISDIPHHIHEQHVVVDETIGLETPEQLLTPENSRSETSSNNENASNEEKPTLRRTSTRATRTSLRSSAQLETPETEKNDTKDGTPVNGVVERRQSHLLRTTSMADIESSLWDARGVARSSTTEADNNNHFALATPVSESSQEMASGEGDTSTLQDHADQPRRSQRKRVSIYEATPDKKSTSTPGVAAARSGTSDDRQPRRRSSRLSISEKASGLLDGAGSVLGKRTRGALAKAKGPDRRSSLRPRDLAPLKNEEANSEAPTAKKRRVSDSDLPSKKSHQRDDAKKEEEAEEPAPPRVPEYKPKRWLTHGLYSGQDPTGPRPVQNRNKTSRRRSRMDAPRKLLPMPLFAGERLLQNGRDYKLPFDIFSPLPPGQPKPNEWRKTNKNVFVGEAGSIWRADKDMELSQCLCVPETGCDENCQNRYMFYECDKGNCRLGPDCGNRSFEELKHRAKAGGKYNVGVEVIKTADRGYGVRSNRSFEPNQVIVEYTGEILTQSECEKRMRTTYKKNECYYLMYFDQNMIIDATRGSIARFVNHSCAPNCRMEKWTVAGKPRMALFAGDRGIMTGEELTYDYNFDPYSQKNVQQCRCGSSECRGVLGPRPREKEQRSKERESRLDNQKQKQAKQNPKSSTKSTATKRKIGNEIDESTSRLNKKQKVVKSGVKKTVTHTASRKRQPATKQKTAKTTKTTKAKTPAKTNAKSKDVKLPKVKSKARVKATVKATASSKGKATSIKASTTTKATTKAATKLNRPSAETKAKILRAAKGAGSRKQTAKTDPKAKTEVLAEPKKRGRKPSNQTREESSKGARAAEPKKRGRKPGVKPQVQPAAEPKKRGRKPSVKTQDSGKDAQPAAEPKKRGRKPGVQALAGKSQPAAEPKKRGRKPGVKALAGKTAQATSEPKKRGRKPGVKASAGKIQPATEPKKRGRKPGVKALAEKTQSATGPKKRGRKPGVKALAEKTQPATEPKKRGRKPGVKYQSSVQGTKGSPKKAE